MDNKNKDAIRLMKYGPMLDDEGAMPDKWDFVKVWLCQGLNRSDSYTVHHSPNLKKALENLRKNHAPEDHNQVIILYKRLYGLKLGPREDPIALINRAHDISTQLKDLKETISEFQVSSAVIAALEISPLYEGTIKALQTIGKEITLNVLLNAFQNVGIPKVAGAFNAEGSQENTQQPENLMDSIANLTKVANQIKSRVNHKRFAPYDKKNKDGNEGRQDDNHGGRGGHQNTRGGYQATRGGYQQNRGGYHGNQNPRGRGGYQNNRGGYRGRGGRVTFSREQRGRGNNRVCYNCGRDNHYVQDCFRPCGACGDRYHKFLDCPLNPMSEHYTGPKKQYSRANSAIDTTSLGEDIPQANFAQAFNAFHPFPADLEWEGPPGYEPGQIEEPVDPTTFFHNIGVAHLHPSLRNHPLHLSLPLGTWMEVLRTILPLTSICCSTTSLIPHQIMSCACSHSSLDPQGWCRHD
jgi:hypothetical protein